VSQLAGTVLFVVQIAAAKLTKPVWLIILGAAVLLIPRTITQNGKESKRTGTTWRHYYPCSAITLGARAAVRVSWRPWFGGNGSNSVGSVRVSIPTRYPDSGSPVSPFPVSHPGQPPPRRHELAIASPYWCCLISKDPVPTDDSTQALDPSRSWSPISQCHKRVRVPVNLTSDELSDPGGS
jgi:hypothetical protein